jgi:hypothetical protein
MKIFKKINNFFSYEKPIPKSDMKLDEFITSSLKSIVKGIKDSQEDCKQNGALINPHIGKWDMEKIETQYVKDEEGARRISKVDFDIAVTASNSSETGGGAGINVYAMKLGGKISDTEKNETVSRIKFDVNIVFPSVDPTTD